MCNRDDSECETVASRLDEVYHLPVGRPFYVHAITVTNTRTCSELTKEVQNGGVEVKMTAVDNRQHKFTGSSIETFYGIRNLYIIPNVLEVTTVSSRSAVAGFREYW